MVGQQVPTKSVLKIEENSKEIVLVVCDGISAVEAAMLANEVAKKTEKEGKRRVLIYVISPLGRPEYFKVIRNVLLKNISLSVSVRYSGSKPKDLLELIKRLSGSEVIVAGLCNEFIQVLDDVGYENVTIIHSGEETRNE
mgnify:CR=1 FL=1